VVDGGDRVNPRVVFSSLASANPNAVVDGGETLTLAGDEKTTLVLLLIIESNYLVLILKI